MQNNGLLVSHNEKYDFIGDIHSCYKKLNELLEKLDYKVNPINCKIETVPDNHILVFLGDLIDRGEYPISVLRLVIQAVNRKQAICLRGNHDDKLYKALIGKKVTISEDLQKTIQAICEEGDKFRNEVTEFLGNLPYQVVINNGEIIAAHGGMKEKYYNIDSKGMRAFALYGGPTGEYDEDGHPIRENWAGEYRGQSMVVYGHTPVSDIKWVNNTINIDSGCFATGILTALRWPEKEIVQTIELKTEEDKKSGEI